MCFSEEKENSVKIIPKKGELAEDKEKQINNKIEKEENILGTIRIPNNENRKWTAAFTMLKINDQPIQVLIDTGASHSVIALEWVEKINMVKNIKLKAVNMIDAQKAKITYYRKNKNTCYLWE